MRIITIHMYTSKLYNKFTQSYYRYVPFDMQLFVPLLGNWSNATQYDTYA